MVKQTLSRKPFSKGDEENSTIREQGLTEVGLPQQPTNASQDILLETQHKGAPAPLQQQQSTFKSHRLLHGAIVLSLIILNAGVIYVSAEVLVRTWRVAQIPVVRLPALPKLASDITPAPTPAEAKTAAYTSTKLGLAFDYPADWEIDDTSQFLTITSPYLAYNKLDEISDGTQKLRQARGSFEIMISDDPTDYLVEGNIATKDSDLITHPSKLKGRTSSYLSYFGYNNSFSSLTLSGGTKYKKGAQVPDNPDYKPIVLAGGYMEADIPRQAFAWDEVPASDFDKTDAFQQSIAIIKSLREAK